MEVPCSRRLARESGLDSFDPRTWSEFKRCVLKQPTLEEEEHKTTKESRHVFLEHMIYKCPWMVNLQDHRTICSTCSHVPNMMTNSFGLEYYNPKFLPVCFTISVQFDKRRDICCYCARDNWRKFMKTKDTKSDEGIVRHGQILVTTHFCSWMIKTYHLKCAMEIGIVTEKELKDNAVALKMLKERTKLQTARYLDKNPHDLLNPCFYSSVLKHHR